VAVRSWLSSTCVLCQVMWKIGQFFVVVAKNHVDCRISFMIGQDNV
jgi:hypothetical protein